MRRRRILVYAIGAAIATLLVVIASLGSAPIAQADTPPLQVETVDGTAVIDIRAGGMAGSVDDVTDLMGPNGRNLYVRYVGDDGGGPYYWDLEGHAAVEVFEGNDTYRVRVDLDSLDGVGSQATVAPPLGPYEAVFVRAGGPHADFWEEGQYPGDDNWNATWSTAYIDDYQQRWSPYLAQHEQVIVRERFTLGGEQPTPMPTATPTPTATGTPTPTVSPTRTTTAEGPTPTVTVTPTAPPTTRVDPGPPPETYTPTPQPNEGGIPPVVIYGLVGIVVVAAIIALIVLGAASGRR